MATYILKLSILLFFKRQEDVIYSLSSRNNLNLMKRENVPEMTRRHTRRCMVSRFATESNSFSE